MKNDVLVGADSRGEERKGRKLLVAVVASLVIMSFLAAPILAVVDFTIPSRVEFNTAVAGSKVNSFNIDKITTQADAEKYPFLWWRDTTAQNALWQHSATQFPNAIIPAYVGADARVLVFVGQPGSNIVAIVGPTGNTIVGCGGSRNAAKVALAAFARAVPNFQVNLRGIILTESSPEIVWGAAEWIGTINRSMPVQVYGSSSILEAGAFSQAVSTANVQHALYAYGPELPYGPNGNLGVGELFGFNPYQLDNGLVIPNRFITAQTTISLGGVSIALMPTAPEDGGLAVYLPAHGVLVLGELFGRYFPPYGSIVGQTTMPVTKWITVLTNMIGLDPDVLIPMHTLPITNNVDALRALTDHKDALTSLHSQVVSKINAMMSYNDIVNTVKLPEPLASSPYLQPYASSVECAVKAIYHYYMGWFNWEIDDLNTLSTVDEAQFIIYMADGPQEALSKAKECITDHTLEGAQKALIISKALRTVAPSHDADLIFVQALRMLGYSQPSGQLRNYYLLMAQRAERAMAP